VVCDQQRGPGRGQHAADVETDAEQPQGLAREITRKLSIPTIGIGAGSHCDGQILVSDDMLGLCDGPPLKFVKRYADLRPAMLKAAQAYCREVQSGAFPAPEHEFADAPKSDKLSA
jgi:3-methyl-2-oxobutanoate hydroxymethyltransferase